MSTLLNAFRNPSITNQPPTAAEQRRNDWAVIIVILFAIFLGWGIRNNTVNAVREFSFQGGIPTITVPASWIKGQGEGLLLRAYDPGSLSTFSSRVEVTARPLRAEEDLSLINVSWPLKRSQELDRFRTLSSQPVTGPTGEAALLLTYAYIADPTRESGTTGLPVVVKGQDLLFVVGQGATRQLVAVTTAADATYWDVEAYRFRSIHDRLGVRGR
jgi:hypothetical protein